MSTPALKRGAAYLADDGTIKVFCDGGYRTLTVVEAISLRQQLDVAIQQATSTGASAKQEPKA